MPSLADSYGLVVSEAMSTGLPVIVSQNSGMADSITDGREGYVVPIRDKRTPSPRRSLISTSIVIAQPPWARRAWPRCDRSIGTTTRRCARTSTRPCFGTRKSRRALSGRIRPRRRSAAERCIRRLEGAAREFVARKILHDQPARLAHALPQRGSASRVNNASVSPVTDLGSNTNPFRRMHLASCGFPAKLRSRPAAIPRAADPPRTTVSLSTTGRPQLRASLTTKPHSSKALGSTKASARA